MVKKKKGNPNPKTDHLKKTQFQNLPSGKAKAIRKKGHKANKLKIEEKKIEEKEKQKFADIFNIILETETKDEELKKKIKEKYPDLKPNNKNLIAIETFTRMFKLKKTTTKSGLVVSKKINNQNFLKYQEYIRDTIGEKPVDEVNNNQVNFNVDIDKDDLKEAGLNIKKMLEDNNF